MPRLPLKADAATAAQFARLEIECDNLAADYRGNSARQTSAQIKTLFEQADSLLKQNAGAAQQPKLLFYRAPAMAFPAFKRLSATSRRRFRASD